MPAPPGEPPRVEWVPEALRDWCETHQRTPLAHEQAQVASQQMARVAAARQRVGPNGWLVVDTTPLQTAVYSQHYFADNRLCADALRQHRLFDVTLLMGLDLPWQADSQLRDGPATQLAVDTLLRKQLQAAQVQHHMVYGTGTARTAAALQAIALALSGDMPEQIEIKNIAEKLCIPSARGLKRQLFWPACESCSDPDCEHLLFSRLVQQRQRVG